MEPKEFLAFLARLEKLKCNTRHSWTSSGRHESVAEHSWRLAMLAMLLRDALPEVDMDKVLRMCLIHDVGEAVTGDIPSFQKTDANEETERQAIAELLSPLPDGLRGELTALFAEMDALATPEARVYKALDKLEVVVQHNEAPLDTWLPLEYELNQTYGIPETAPFPPLAALREQARLDTLAKLAEKPIRRVSRYSAPPAGGSSLPSSPTALSSSRATGSSATPATRLSHWFRGMRIRRARACPTATAMAGEISPIRASAMTMPRGPKITSARRQATSRAFSPVAP